jgi:cysteine desulfurase
MVYLDNIAATPVDRRVISAMMPYISKHFANPSSIHHLGQIAKRELESARESIADLISAKLEEIVFTSSGTEANNLAIKGTMSGEIIASVIEHISILHPLKTLEKRGFKVHLIPVDKEGRIDVDQIKDRLSKETKLVSIQLANPEIGTVQDIAKISEVVRENSDALFHTDAVSAAGRLKIDVEELGVDLLTISASQMYGPKGAAALFIKKGTRVLPQIEGGIQERGRRAGTENVAAIVGFGECARIAKREISDWIEKIKALQERLISGLFEKIDNIHLNSSRNGLCGIVNVSFEKIEGESLLLSLDLEGICASSGSPCVSHALKASHVLTAIGLDPVSASGSLLFSIGKENTEEDIEYLLEKLPPIVERLRKMSPL